MGMLPYNLSDALLVFLYGVMATLFVQWVMGMFTVKERIEWLERSVYNSGSRLLDFEEDMASIKEFVRRSETERLAESMTDVVKRAEAERPRLRLHAKPAERRTGARSPRRAKG